MIVFPLATFSDKTALPLPPPEGSSSTMSSMGIGKILLLALAPAAALVALLYVLGVFHIAANHEANQHLVVQSALESVNSAMKNAQNSAEKAGGAGEANAFLSLASPPNTYIV